MSYNLNFWLRFLTKSFNRNMPTHVDLGKNSEDLDYYCKINDSFRLSEALSFNDINLLRNSGYSYDLYSILYPFGKNHKFRFLPGDITHVPDEPTFVKSRPVTNGNQNSVLLPLDSFRHLRFVNDGVPFECKKNNIVWRGAAYQKHRIDFLRKCSHFSFADLGNTAVSESGNVEFEKPRLSIKEQLRSKFVVSIEGNDVATNLKWIMSSNSVCMMPEPKFETWYKEGTLVLKSIISRLPMIILILLLNTKSIYPPRTSVRRSFRVPMNMPIFFRSSQKVLKIARMTALKYFKFCSFDE